MVASDVQNNVVRRNIVNDHHANNTIVGNEQDIYLANRIVFSPHLCYEKCFRYNK